VRESQAWRSVNQRLAEEERLQKASDKELKAAATLYKKRIAEEKRVAQEEAKVVSDRAKAEKAAEIAAKNVTTQARQEIRIWRGLTQRHMGVRGRTVT
jgi:hypothetical protein